MTGRGDTGAPRPAPLQGPLTPQEPARFPVADCELRLAECQGLLNASYASNEALIEEVLTNAGDDFDRDEEIAVQYVRALEERLSRILQLHEAVTDDGDPWCSECSPDAYEDVIPHPCATVRLVNGEEV